MASSAKARPFVSTWTAVSGSQSRILRKTARNRSRSRSGSPPVKPTRSVAVDGLYPVPQNDGGCYRSRDVTSDNRRVFDAGRRPRVPRAG
jgi:hypothetical protein